MRYPDAEDWTEALNRDTELLVDAQRMLETRVAFVAIQEELEASMSLFGALTATVAAPPTRIHASVARRKRAQLTPEVVAEIGRRNSLDSACCAAPRFAASAATDSTLAAALYALAAKRFATAAREAEVAA